MKKEMVKKKIESLNEIVTIMPYYHSLGDHVPQPLLLRRAPYEYSTYKVNKKTIDYSENFLMKAVLMSISPPSSLTTLILVTVLPTVCPLVPLR
jgi:hypothetical protein